MKKIIPIILIVLLCGCTAKPDKIGMATISIECKTILQNMEKLDEGVKKVLPEDGVVLSEVEVDIYDGDNLYNVLTRTAKSEKLVLNITGNSYIVGINGISEFSCGELSGWMFRFNEEIGSKSIAEQLVAPDDKIELLYTCNLGDDLK